ncbi:hypothetical protein HDZ31DRAFT_77670, partial [Schizophyllum fasciatum]
EDELDAFAGDAARAKTHPTPSVLTPPTTPSTSRARRATCPSTHGSPSPYRPAGGAGPIRPSPAHIGEASLDAISIFLADFGMYEYAHTLHAQGLRTREDCLELARDCGMDRTILLASLEELFPDIPARKRVPFGLSLLRETHRDLIAAKMALFDVEGEGEGGCASSAAGSSRRAAEISDTVIVSKFMYESADASHESQYVSDSEPGRVACRAVLSVDDVAGHLSEVADSEEGRNDFRSM